MPYDITGKKERDQNDDRRFPCSLFHLYYAEEIQYKQHARNDKYRPEGMIIKGLPKSPGKCANECSCRPAQCTGNAE